MKKEEIVELINSIIESLKTNPSQFYFDVSVNTIGMKASATQGGIGAVGQAFGGGTGINVRTSVGDTEINVANKIADEKIQEQMNDAISLLEKLKDAISQKTNDTGRIKSILDDFRASKILSGVISSVLGYLLTKYLGI
jgi:uncharacterized protein YcfJ